MNARSLRPGDRVFFAGGETFTGTIELNDDDAGTPAQPVLISSYGSGRATIHGGSTSAIVIFNAAGLLLRRLDLRGNGPDRNTGAGVSAGVERPNDAKLSWLHFEEMTISGFHKGVEIWAWFSPGTPAWPGFRDVELRELEVFNNRSVGIEVSGTWLPNGDGTHFSHANVTIAHCTVWDNRGDPQARQHSGNGIVVGGVDQATIEFCVAHDNGGIGPATGGGPFGIWAWESRGVTIQSNLVYNQRSSSPVDGGAYDLDGGCADSIVQYNYSYHNDGPAVGLIQFGEASPHRNNVVRFNISENDCRGNSQGVLYVGEFSTGPGIDQAEIYSNTFFVSANSGDGRGRPPLVHVENQDGIANVRIRNNLFIAAHPAPLITGALSAPAKARFQGNNYWGGSFDLAQFRTGGQETVNGTPVGLRVDPRLRNPGGGGAPTSVAQLPEISGYRLSADSPLIGAGLNLSQLFGMSPGTRDFFGAPLTDPLSVGASNFHIPEPTSPPARKSTLAAISVRAFCGAGDRVSIGGFVISGDVAKTVLLRAVGPSLTAAGLAAGEILSDPVLELHDALKGNVVIATNDNWSDNANSADILSATARTGASPLAASDTRSAALLITLNPGVYTFVISGGANSTGVVLTEIYDADANPGGSILAGISGRVYCGSGNDVSIGGFVVGGSAPQRLLVRAVGPTLTTAGLNSGEVLPDPAFTLHDALNGNAVIARNENWGDAPNAAEMVSTARRIGASDLASNDSKSAALLLTLAPGVYTFVISNQGPGAGVVLTEIYSAD